jgi:hypothetical protein
MIKKITHKNTVLAIIIYSTYSKEGIEFFTPVDYSQQLGYMNHPSGYIIKPHTHNIVPREVTLTQEVLYIKSGKVRVDFYNQEQDYIESTIIQTGDVILLAAGGHGFEMLEKTQMIEIKQGPYIEEEDKIRFEPISSKEINL